MELKSDRATSAAVEVITSAAEVRFFLYVFCLSVSRITQKAPTNFDEFFSATGSH